MKKTWKAVPAGLLAGIINGLFGAGGGLILVPFFIRILKISPEEALPTSIAVILPLSAVSAFVYLSGGTEWGSLWPFLVGGLAGGALGGWLFDRVQTLWLRRALGAMMIYSAVRALFFP